MNTRNFIGTFLCLLSTWLCTSVKALPPTCTTTCPGNLSVSTSANSCSAVVNYPPITSDCPVTTVPSSGTTFPIGATTVNVFNGGCTEVYAVINTNGLIHENINNPGSGTSSLISGVLPGEVLNGIDFRPSNGQLYGIGTNGNSAHLYTINTSTAVATVVGPGFPLPGVNPSGSIGFDFNPMTDRIRVTSGPTLNMRIDPNTGTPVASDAAFSGGNIIAGVAYSNNYSGTPNTTLYGIDDLTNSLVIIGGPNGSPSPNSGIITPVGPLGIGLNSIYNGFDITACDNVGYLVKNTNPFAVLYRVNLSTGQAVPVGPSFGPGGTVKGFAIQPSAPSCTFNVIVTDNTPPQITCPPNIVVSNGPNQCGANVTYVVSASDNCSLQSLVSNPPSGSFFPNGTTTVTATATDANNNSSQCQFTVTVNGNSPTPSQITGPLKVCKGQTATYCTNAIPGSTGYVWTLPPGATGTSSTNCITVSFSTGFNGGNICVSATNLCGTGSPYCMNLILQTAKPAKPDPIAGITPVCAPSSQIYCIPPVPNADSYVWALGGNGGIAPATLGVGQGTTCITVNFPAGYNGAQELKVRASNCKGLSDERKIDLKVLNPPAMPGTITGPASVCKNQLGFYSISSVAGATGYQWSVTGNVWIAGGQGTTSLALDFMTSNATSAVISVVASNACGVSPARTKTVVINPACKLAPGEIESSQAAGAEIDGKIYPNPSSGKVTLEYNMNSATNVSLKVFDLTGRIMYSQVLNSIEGVNQTDLDLSTLPKAVYILRIEDEHESRTIQLVIN